MENRTQTFACQQCCRTWQRDFRAGRHPQYCPDCARERINAQHRADRAAVRTPQFTECQRPGCGNPLQPGSRADAKWCSVACQSWAQRRASGQISTTPRLCSSCLQPLEGRNAATAKVCRSRRCRAWNQRHPGQPHPSTQPRSCVWCGKSIDHRNARAKFCAKPASCEALHWQATHPEAAREIGRKHKTSPQGKAYQKKYAKDHAEDRRRWAREARKRDPERYRAYYKSWVKANKSAWQAADKNTKSKRRAQKFGNGLGVGVSLRDWQRLIRRYNGSCVYCGGVTGPEPAQDHVIPLALGGTHSVGNVLPSCTFCNSTKHKMLLSVWKYRCGGGKPAPEGWTKSSSVLRGERNGNTPFTDEDVREIRRAHRDGVSQTELARRRGVSVAAISGIVRWKAWTHVSPEDRPVITPGRLTDTQVRQIRRLYGSGVSQKALAAQFGTNQATVSLVVRRKSYEHVL
jgi:DNA-binding transcriptional regulator YiaG